MYDNIILGNDNDTICSAEHASFGTGVIVGNYKRNGDAVIFYNVS